jgi:hypothetical protein
MKPETPAGNLYTAGITDFVSRLACDAMLRLERLTDAGRLAALLARP